MHKKLHATLIDALLTMAALAVCWGGASSASAREAFFGFEDEWENSTWGVDGGYAGVDRGLGLAYEGQNNGWIRAGDGWHALYRIESAGEGARECVAFAQVRMTQNLTGMYFSLIDQQTGAILSESAWRGDMVAPYQYVWIGTGLAHVLPYQQLVVRVGFWGNGQDAWVHVDNVELFCS